MEYLDEIDKNDTLTGNKYDREYIHKNLIGHRHVSAWIINKDGNLLIQRRSYKKTNNPGLWAKTGGHVASGESPDDAIIREINEEIGILLDIKDFEFYRAYHNPKDNTYCHNYIVEIDKGINDFILDKEEVEEVKYIKIEELEKLVSERNKEYIFHEWDKEDFADDMNILRIKREEIINRK